MQNACAIPLQSVAQAFDYSILARGQGGGDTLTRTREHAGHRLVTRILLVGFFFKERQAFHDGVVLDGEQYIFLDRGEVTRSIIRYGKM